MGMPLADIVHDAAGISPSEKGSGLVSLILPLETRARALVIGVGSGQTRHVQMVVTPEAKKNPSRFSVGAFQLAIPNYHFQDSIINEQPGRGDERVLQHHDVRQAGQPARRSGL